MVIAFLFGVFVGAIIGILVAGLMCAAGKDSRNE